MRPESRIQETTKSNIIIHPLRETELSAADSIMRLAFGTFIGLPEPMSFMGDAAYIRNRWLANPEAAFAAEAGGEVIGSNFATNWGSVGFFGPLTVRPDHWDRGIAQRLLEPAMQLFETRQTRHAGLFTFPYSPRHLHLYQKFGFWPRFLTAIMSAPVHPLKQAARGEAYSNLTEAQKMESLAACRALTDSIFEGLDVQHEIRTVSDVKLGETLLLWNDS